MTSEVALAPELQDYLDKDGNGTYILRHPFITYLGCGELTSEEAEMLNRWLVQKQAALKEAEKNRDWSLVLMLHEKAWRLQALVEYGPRMTDEEYFDNLGQTWCEVENLWQHYALLPCILDPSNRDPAARQFMMTKDERAALNDMPDTVKIFRGCGSKNKMGWSWTIDEEQAAWFAERWAGEAGDDFGGLVLEGRCSKSLVIAYINRRGEDEILVDPANVSIVYCLAVEGDDSNEN